MVAPIGSDAENSPVRPVFLSGQQGFGSGTGRATGGPANDHTAVARTQKLWYTPRKNLGPLPAGESAYIPAANRFDRPGAASLTPWT